MIQIKQNYSKCYSRGVISKSIFTLLLTLVLMLPSRAFAAATPEPYVVLNGTTLTFYYDENKSLVSTGMAYDLKNYSWIDLPQWYGYTTVVLDQSMQNYHPTSTAFWFWMGSQLTSIDLSYLNTDQLTDMTAMFFGCSQIETLDLSNFNTSKVTRADIAFQNCSKLRDVIVDPTKWNMNNLEDPGVLLFYNNPLLMGGAGTIWQPGNEYSTLNYARVDGGASAPGYFKSKTQTKPTVASIAIKTLPAHLTYAPGEPLNFDGQGRISVTLSNGRSMEQSLSYTNITGYTNDIGVQTLNVEYYGKTTTFNITVEDKVAPYCYKFGGDTYFFVYDKYQDGYIYICDETMANYDESKWDIKNVIFTSSFKNYYPTSCANWFNGFINLTTFYYWENLNTDKVTNMFQMFKNCESLTSLDLKYFNTAKVTDMTNMFYDCSKLETIKVGSLWKTSAVTESGYMFQNCTSLKGGSGTTYDETKTDYTYAKIDGGTSSPGYFSLPDSEPYALINGNTLTFYYDNARPAYAYDFHSNGMQPWGWNQSITKVVFNPSFAEYTPTTCSNLFYGLMNLSQIEGLEYLNTSEVTDMGAMFNCCFALTSLDLSNFDTRKVTNMFQMFCACRDLKTIYVGNNFQIGNNVNTDQMFSGDYHLVGSKGTVYLFENDDIYNGSYAHIDGGESNPGLFSAKGQTPPAVTQLSISTMPKTSFSKLETFSYTNGQLSVTYNGRAPQIVDFSSAEVSGKYDSTKVGTYAMTIKYGGKTISYNVKVEDKDDLYCTKSSNNVLTIYYGKYKNGAKLFTQLPSSFKESITKVIIDESVQNYTNLTSCNQWFCYFYKLTEIEGLDNVNTANVTDMSYMFCQCRKLQKLYLTSFKTANVTNMSEMFNGCTSLTNIYISNDWSTSSVTNSSSMFNDCTSLQGSSGTAYDATKIDYTYARLDGGTSSPGYLSSIQAYYVTDTLGVRTFYYNSNPPANARIIKGTDLSNMGGNDITKVVIDKSFAQFKPTTCSFMFGGSYNLTEISGLQYLNTSRVTNMLSMFLNCSLLRSLDLSSFDTRKVDTLGVMFNSCKNLHTIYVGDKWTIENVTEDIQNTYMFYGCINLVGGRGTTYDLDSRSFIQFARIDGGAEAPGLLTRKGAEKDTVLSISVSLSKNQYLVGEELDLSNSILSITYSDGSKENTSLNKAKISGYNANKASTQTITATYMNSKTTFEVTVNDPAANPYTKPAFADSCYQIGTANELLWFMFNVNSGDVTANAVLTQDIVINQDCLNQITKMLNKTSKAAPALVEWRPIGDSNNAVRGVFDGQGHTISGLYIKDETLDNVGLFGNVGADAVIKNVGVVDSYISGNENVGAICGKSEGTIANCYSTSIVSGAKNVGGVVGVIEEEAVVCNSYNLGSVTSEDGQSAGVCNTASTNAVVENCYYLAEEPVTNDPQAKTAEQFKSGEVAELLSQNVEINGVVYSNENVSANTEIPGMEEIEQRNNLTTPVAQVANKDNNIKVWSNHRSIFIETLPNTKYTIIDNNGRLITASTTKSTHEEIGVNYNGMLIVIINGSSFKVYVK